MKYIYPILFVLAFTVTSFAQKTNNGDMRKERRDRIESRIESQKVAYITQKLELTPEEAQQFWPIYNEFQAKMKELRYQSRLDLQIEDISENEANSFLDKLMNQEQNEVDLRKQYFNKLKSVVSVKKVAQLYVLEKKFREEILATIRNKMGKKKRKTKNRN